MVDKQPPPNFFAPQAAIIVLKKLFIVSFFLSLTLIAKLSFKDIFQFAIQHLLISAAY